MNIKNVRYLGIDFGLKRVGLAITDSRGSLAFPHKTLLKRDKQTFFAELLDVLEQEGIQAIVVGLPLDLEGRESLRTRQANNFMQRLKRRTNLPVYAIDESLSSQEADERLQATGLPASKRKAVLDQEAAVIILQRYLQQKTR